MRLCRYFPHLLSDLGEIRYKRSAHGAVERFCVSSKSPQGRPWFYCGPRVPWNSATFWQGQTPWSRVLLFRYVDTWTLHTAVVGTVRPLIGTARQCYACSRNICAVGGRTVLSACIATRECPTNSNFSFVWITFLEMSDIAVRCSP
jgi:hypothetical protein